MMLIQITTEPLNHNYFPLAPFYFIKVTLSITELLLKSEDQQKRNNTAKKGPGHEPTKVIREWPLLNQRASKKALVKVAIHTFE